MVLKKIKKCKCGSPKCYPTFGYSGYNYRCAPSAIKEVAEKKFRKKIQSKIDSVKKYTEKRKNKFSENKVKLEQWHQARRYEATGFCRCCGAPTSKYDDKHYKYSNCHILPKSDFKSVMLHPMNCIELSYWNGCHTKFDKSSEHWDKLACWPEIVRKFKILYPLTTPEEHQFIPEILLKTLV